jgi:hypothetical protein
VRERGRIRRGHHHGRAALAERRFDRRHRRDVLVVREHLPGAAQILEWSEPAEQIDEERTIHAPLDVRVVAVHVNRQLPLPA